MSLFDGLQDIISSVTGGNAQDAISNITEQLPLDDVANMQEGAGDALTGASETATSKIDEIKGTLGL